MKYCSYMLWLFLGMSLCAGAPGCRDRDDAEMSGGARDTEIAPYQTELLDIAFEAATAMPVQPHIKDRSRAQEAVVTACLELDQPERALRYLKGIDNWRRGIAYADLAWYCAQRGLTNDVKAYLDEASRIADTAEDWRKDRIKIKVSQTYAYLGRNEAAARSEQGLEDSASGALAKREAITCSAETFNDTMKGLKQLVSAGDLDAVKNALAAYAELFKSFYADAGKRAEIEKDIKAAWEAAPLFLRIELLFELAGIALDRDDPAKAIELLDEARNILDGADWPPRAYISLLAKQAKLRFHAGDGEGASAEVREAIDLFQTRRKQIVNIYRAETLHPIAEALQAMGQTESALHIYARAVEAGVENPNSRPRAEDLAATCCSMAVYGAKPGAELLRRIHEVRDDLGDPW